MQNFTDQIRNNMNANGGGLASNITGKFESNRHAIARVEKVTFGEAVKELAKNKNGGLKISAAELLDIYRANFGEPEWHHAGKLPKQYGGGMKKTYFLNEIPTPEQVDEWRANSTAKREEKKTAAEIENNKKAIRMKFLKKHGVKFNRELTTPKFSFIEDREMNGKYGWFEAQPHRYNLPVYYSGWSFKSQKTLEKYFKL